jgi:spermidine/putrescine transport system substrate-binding protein
MNLLGRRRFLRLQLGALAAVLGRVRGAEEDISSVAAGKVLRVHSWTGFLDPDLLRKFGAAAGCRVEQSFFETNEELYAALNAGKEAYDVVSPSGYMGRRLAREGKLAKLALAESKVAGGELLCSPLEGGIHCRVADCQHGVPFSWSVSGIATNRKHFQGVPESWRSFEDSRLAKRFTLLDDMRELLGAALKCLGKSGNSVEQTELDSAEALVAQWLKGADKLTAADYCFGLVAGEYLACHSYDGDIGLARAAEPELAFHLPSEGAMVSVDELAVPSNAADPELAHEFIEFWCDPANAAANSRWSGFGSLNLGAIAPRDIKAINERLAGCEVIEDLGDQTGQWEARWQRLFRL